MPDVIIHKRIKLEELDTTLSCLRITRPGDLGRMRQSLERSGQLNPIVIRPFDDRFQILDGFKRYMERPVTLTTWRRIKLTI